MLYVDLVYHNYHAAMPKLMVTPQGYPVGLHVLWFHC